MHAEREIRQNHAECEIRQNHAEHENGNCSFQNRAELKAGSQFNHVINN